MANDIWGGQFNNVKKILHGSIYAYIVDINQKDLVEGSVIIPPVESIQSVYLMPHLEVKDCIVINDIEFDTTRFPIGDKPLPEGTLNKLTRITSLTRTRKVISSKVKSYKTAPNTGGLFSHKNESKLYQYPFTYHLITDGYAAPLEIKPQFLPNQDVTTTHQLRSIRELGGIGSYGLGVDGYKGDETGFMETMINSESRNVAISSSAYQAFMSRTQSQLAASKKANELGVISSLANIAKTAGAGALAGGPVGALVGAGVGLLGTGIGYMNTVNQKIAEQQDLKTTPHSLKSGGADIGMIEAMADGNIHQFIYRLEEQSLVQIGSFFHMYGYAQNKIMKVNLRSRKDYNYVKTVGANIKGNGIPKNHYEVLKNIYNKGVTIWHQDRNRGALNYAYDNVEI